METSFFVDYREICVNLKSDSSDLEVKVKDRTTEVENHS